MRGMSRTTGKAIDGIEHAEQRLIDVLTTSKGERVMNRDYGAGLMSLVGKNITAQWMVEASSSIAEALENRINGLRDLRMVKLERVSSNETGIVLDLICDYLPTRQRILFNGISINL